MENKESVYKKKFEAKCTGLNITDSRAVDIVRDLLLSRVDESKKTADLWQTAFSNIDWFYNGQFVKEFPGIKPQYYWWCPEFYSTIGTTWYNKFKERCAEQGIRGMGWITHAYLTILSYCSKKELSVYDNKCEAAYVYFDRYYIWSNHYKAPIGEFYTQFEQLCGQKGLCDSEGQEAVLDEMRKLIQMDEDTCRAYILKHFDDLWAQVYPPMKDVLDRFEPEDAYSQLTNLCKSHHITDTEEALESILRFVVNTDNAVVIDHECCDVAYRNFDSWYKALPDLTLTSGSSESELQKVCAKHLIIGKGEIEFVCSSILESLPAYIDKYATVLSCFPDWISNHLEPTWRDKCSDAYGRFVNRCICNGLNVRTLQDIDTVCDTILSKYEYESLLEYSDSYTAAIELSSGDISRYFDKVPTNLYTDKQSESYEDFSRKCYWCSDAYCGEKEDDIYNFIIWAIPEDTRLKNEDGYLVACQFINTIMYDRNEYIKSFMPGERVTQIDLENAMNSKAYEKVKEICAKHLVIGDKEVDFVCNQVLAFIPPVYKEVYRDKYEAVLANIGIWDFDVSPYSWRNKNSVAYSTLVYECIYKGLDVRTPEDIDTVCNNILECYIDSPRLLLEYSNSYEAALKLKRQEFNTYFKEVPTNLKKDKHSEYYMEFTVKCTITNIIYPKDIGGIYNFIIWTLPESEREKQEDGYVVALSHFDEVVPHLDSYIKGFIPKE